MKKQTAVEWLLDYCERENWSIPNDIIEQAKALEKQQIIDAYHKGFTRELGNRNDDSDQYFTETYGENT